MEPMFSEIIKNAIQASPDGGKLRGSTENSLNRRGYVSGESEKDTGSAVIIDLPAKTQ